MSTTLAETSSKVADATNNASCPLFRCPNGILLAIADCLSRTDVGWLVHASRRCHRALNAYLYILDQRPVSLCCSALLWACSLSKLETARKVLAAGADSNTEWNSNHGAWRLLDKYTGVDEGLGPDCIFPTRSASQIVAALGNVETARLLIKSGKADFSRPALRPVRPPRRESKSA